MVRHFVYGCVLESDIDFPELPFAPPVVAPDVHVETETAQKSTLVEPYRLRLVSEEQLAGGERAARIFEDSSAYLLSYTDIADFRVDKAGRRVCFCPVEGAPHEEERALLLGGVLSFALELQHIPCLHSSAVVLPEGAAVFLGTAGGGKSTLAAALVQAGFPLLSDDIVALRSLDGAVVGSPGYPQMRLWPNEAQHFLGRTDHLKPVLPSHSKLSVPIGGNGFGTFCDIPRPLSCIYLPELVDDPGEGDIEITAVSPRDAVIELVRCSFSASIVEALGLQPGRFAIFAQLVRQAPMRRLRYPRGMQHLSRVREALIADAAQEA